MIDANKTDAQVIKIDASGYTSDLYTYESDSDFDYSLDTILYFGILECQRLEYVKASVAAGYWLQNENDYVADEIIQKIYCSIAGRQKMLYNITDKLLTATIYNLQWQSATNYYTLSLDRIAQSVISLTSIDFLVYHEYAQSTTRFWTFSVNAIWSDGTITELTNVNTRVNSKTDTNATKFYRHTITTFNTGTEPPFLVGVSGSYFPTGTASKIQCYITLRYTETAN